MVTRRAFVQGGLALPLLTAPAFAQKSANIIRFGLSAFPPSIMPWENTGAAAGTVKSLIHRGLVSYDNKGELRGELAQSWSIDGQGAWIFKLRPDAFFQNGDPVTVDDVKWSIEQIGGEKSTAYMRAQFQAITSVETPDATTIRVITKEPYATLPLWFAGYNSFIISHKSTPTAPIGAGPFKITAQDRGTSIELTAVDKFYRPGFPKLKGIKFVAYPDDSLRSAALMAGDVDIIEYVPYQTMDSIEKTPSLKLQAIDGPFMCILFNGTNTPFADPRVRQAVAFAIRRDEIAKAVFLGRGAALNGVPIPANTPFYDESLANYWGYDPVRAKKLLADAGVPNGFQTTLLSNSTYEMHKDTAEIVQQHLAEIGIQCQLQLPDWATRVSLGTRGQYQFAIHGLLGDNNDPDGLSSIMDPSLSPSYARSFGLSAPRTTAAFAKGRAEFDLAKRVEIYKDLQRAVLDEVSLLSLCWRSQGYALNQSVQGFTNLPGALTVQSGAMLEETYFG